MEYGQVTYDLYHDISMRTNGEIYLGIIGPVRTGKSTFIKRFMNEMVFPNMEEGPEKTRALDELPQSAGGKTITTTEPKFVPSEAVSISVGGELSMKVRLVDCVGYMVDGASGHLEDEKERMVKTPWFDYEIPFTQAAGVGTDKVIREHSTIGIVVTTDGSVTDLPRESYLEAEEKTIREMKQLGKPFLVLLNCKKPYSKEAKELALDISEKYQVTIQTVNCEQLKKEDFQRILESALYEFPITSMEIYLPKWLECVDKQEELKKHITEHCMSWMNDYHIMKDLYEKPISAEDTFIQNCKLDQVDLSNGKVTLKLDLDEKYYYDMLSELFEEPVEDESDIMEHIRGLSKMKQEYASVNQALESVRAKGYGVVTPKKEEIVLKDPEIIKNGNKYGVKIKAFSPSVHFIKADIETEISPIVGTKEQAEDLMSYIQKNRDEDDLWNTNIFGKTVEQLVEEGIQSKITNIDDASQTKLQDSMQKIVNECNGGMVCIII